MKALHVALATILIFTFVHSELNADLVEKLKKAYEQSLNDVMNDLLSKKTDEASLVKQSEPIVSRSTKVLSNSNNVTHKILYKNGSRSVRVNQNGGSISPMELNGFHIMGKPQVHVSGFVKRIESVTDKNGHTTVKETTQQISPSNIASLEHDLSNGAGILGRKTCDSNTTPLLGGLLDFPFDRDIDEEQQPVVMIRRIQEPRDNPLEGLLDGLLEGLNSQPQYDEVSSPMRRRVVRPRPKRVIRRRVIRRRPVPADEELHPEVAHVARLYGDFLDNEIARHQNNQFADNADAYHHKMIRPKLITVREVPSPVSSIGKPQVSVVRGENSEPDGISIRGTIEVGPNGVNPMDVIRQALQGLSNQEQSNFESPVIQSIVPIQDSPIHVRIIGPGADSNDNLGNFFGNLINRLEGNDIAEEVHPVHHTTHTVHHVSTVHRIHHAPALINRVSAPVAEESPIQQLLDSLESASRPQINRQRPKIVVKRISTPLLNESYGKPLLYGASVFPQVGHGKYRRDFNPIDVTQFFNRNLPDPKNRNKKSGFIRHKRNTIRRARPQGNSGSVLTGSDLQQIIEGMLTPMVRRKRNLVKNAD